MLVEDASDGSDYRSDAGRVTEDGTTDWVWLLQALREIADIHEIDGHQAQTEYYAEAHAGAAIDATDARGNLPGKVADFHAMLEHVVGPPRR